MFAWLKKIFRKKKEVPPDLAFYPLSERRVTVHKTSAVGSTEGVARSKPVGPPNVMITGRETKRASKKGGDDSTPYCYDSTLPIVGLSMFASASSDSSSCSSDSSSCSSD